MVGTTQPRAVDRSALSLFRSRRFSLFSVFPLYVACRCVPSREELVQVAQDAEQAGALPEPREAEQGDLRAQARPQGVAVQRAVRRRHEALQVRTVGIPPQVLSPALLFGDVLDLH